MYIRRLPTMYIIIIIVIIDATRTFYRVLLLLFYYYIISLYSVVCIYIILYILCVYIDFHHSHTTHQVVDDILWFIFYFFLRRDFRILAIPSPVHVRYFRSHHLYIRTLLYSYNNNFFKTHFMKKTFFTLYFLFIRTWNDFWTCDYFLVIIYRETLLSYIKITHWI